MSGEYRMTRRVEFAETDMAGVMHFANYFRFMEEVEHAFWRSVGESVHQGQGDQVISWPRVATQCEYAAPVRFEDELELRLSVSRLGTKSVEFTVDFQCGGKQVARARTTAVCCRVGSGNFAAIVIPDHLREKLKQIAVRE